MEYSWKNDELWQISVSEEDFQEFEQPYLGNGILGCRFEKLVIGVDEKPLYNLSRAVYDGGNQLFLPAWNHIGLFIEGVKYIPENGKHRLKQVLDLRSGVVSMQDHWEYKNGETINIDLEMFVPRTFEHSAYMSFTIKDLKRSANIKFGILGKGLSKYYQMKFTEIDATTVIGDYTTKKQNRPVSQVVSCRYSGLTAFTTSVEQESITVSADTCSEIMKLEVFHAISSYEEGADTRENALKRVKSIMAFGRDRLLEISTIEWKKLWENALAFRSSDAEREKMLIAHQFYLLGSLEVCDYPLGPLGLSKNEWGGNQLWDADLWVFRAVLPLWPDFARSVVSFRKKTLEAAKNHAKVTGYKGAWYAWQTSETGENITNIHYNDELHINIWIALAAWEYYVLTENIQYLEESGWPIIREVADFFASRVEFERDGYYHLNVVLGPDEAVTECGHFRVNDNFTTNYGVKKLMKIVCEASVIVGEEVKELWKEVMGKMYLLSPDANGIIPEYEGYYGHGIKQADLLLAFYPLEYEAEKEIKLKNIKFYRDKLMYYGPLMSAQIESCILMKLGDKGAGLKRLFGGMNEYMKGKHYIPFECRDNDNSIMLTGIGGELQALIFGYYGADLKNTNSIPRMAEYMKE